MEVNVKEKIHNIKPNRFWEKININFDKIGTEVLHKALILFYALYDDNVPYWARGVVVGALSYFLIPFDAMPDVVPIAGYADDLAILGLALSQLWVYVSDETKEKAQNKLNEILEKFSDKKEELEEKVNQVKDTVEDIKNKAGNIADSVKEMTASKSLEEKENVEVIKEVNS
jgi:uncharacterized membrane protein YkvA (DUF1232 family)